MNLAYVGLYEFVIFTDPETPRVRVVGPFVRVMFGAGSVTGFALTELSEDAQLSDAVLIATCHDQRGFVVSGFDEEPYRRAIVIAPLHGTTARDLEEQTRAFNAEIAAARRQQDTTGE